MDDNHIFFEGEIFNPPQGTTHDTHQGNNSIPELRAVVIQQTQKKIKFFSVFYLKKVVSNQLIDQIFSQFGCNLKSIDPKTQKNFTDAVNVAFRYKSIQFMFVLKENYLSRFFSFRFTFVLDHFVVFSQLNLICLKHLSNLRLACLFQTAQHLHQSNRYSKYAF